MEKGGGKLGWEFTREKKRKDRKIGCAFICEMRYLSSDGLTYPSSDSDVSGLNYIMYVCIMYVDGWCPLLVVENELIWQTLPANP